MAFGTPPIRSEAGASLLRKGAPSGVADPCGEGFNGIVQLEFRFLSPDERRQDEPVFTLGGHRLPVRFSRNAKARSYIIRLLPEGRLKVTIPRGGTMKEAQALLGRKAVWIEKQVERLEARRIQPATWPLGTRVFYRGELREITRGPARRYPCASLGGLEIRVKDIEGDLRSEVEAALQQKAAEELIPRALQLAEHLGIDVTRVQVRNQRTRWGSCSSAGNISLNWRLIQTPSMVSDYIIIHELMHRREMNHSTRFWKLVETACPVYKQAELWIKTHAGLLERMEPVPGKKR